MHLPRKPMKWECVSPMKDVIIKEKQKYNTYCWESVPVLLFIQIQINFWKFVYTKVIFESVQKKWKFNHSNFSEKTVFRDTILIEVN